LVTDSHRILARWSINFSQLFIVHGINDVRQTEIRTAEPPLPELSAFEIEIAFEKLKRLKLPVTDQISAELIIVEGRKIPSWIGRSRSLYLFIRMTIKQIIVITQAYHFCQLCTKFYSTSCCQC
jgi:hypothetical protein